MIDLRSTKADVLDGLRERLRTATILPSHVIVVDDWLVDREAHVEAVVRRLGDRPWIVRSSARAEDRAGASLAGAFDSVADVVGRDALERAIDQVIGSYGMHARPDDQVLVQPMLRGVHLAGVAFTADPGTGAPYRVVDFTTDGSTNGVTSGRAGVRTWVQAQGSDATPPPGIAPVLATIDEIDELVPWTATDLEFAVTADGVVVLQARPLALSREPVAPEHHARLRASVRDWIDKCQRPHPFLHGRTTVFGVMPDWNPAEIIGIRPRPLALSLYKDLVTDSTWAYQRNNYGYRNVRGHPLIHSLHGLPYVDVRASFNSFVPGDIDGPLAERLVNHYVDSLIARPTLHDKVEFDIVFSCYTLDLPSRLGRLRDAGFSERETQRLADSLRRLTSRVIDPERGLWRGDAARLDVLVERHARLMAADLEPLDRLVWLLEDCRRYGTLPFAGLARAGFIAVQMLRSLVTVGLLSEDDAAAFMADLDTVSSQLTRDVVQLDRSTFLAKYGHLRPGTYDIGSPRYDETPELYLSHGGGASRPVPHRERFTVDLGQLRDLRTLLSEHDLALDPVDLLTFCRSAMELREHAKFLFTRNLSDAISLLSMLGAEHGLSDDDMSYVDVRVVRQLASSCSDPATLLERSIAEGRAVHADSSAMWLPPLITGPDDVDGFLIPESEPNFVTQLSATGPIRPPDPELDLAGAVVLIPHADPGYDWLFSRGIAGLVTAYGGVNSHMAIRASELRLPAVIGVGEAAFEQWSKASVLRLDCGTRRVDAIA